MTRLTLAAGCIALAFGGAAPAQRSASHTIIKPDSIKWMAGPASLPPGAKSAVLYGDPSKPQLFILRLWLPKGYRILPHTHPRPELVTVISGSSNLGFGKVADRAKTNRLTAGAFMATPQNTPHYVFIEEDTVVQLSTIGPWAVTYVNPADDPRKKSR